MIPVKNLYYMLSYAFRALKDLGLKDADIESFDNSQELYTEIITRCVNNQIKRGLGREYMANTEPIGSVKGKIDVSETIKTRTLPRRRVVCTYDIFSYDTALNRIIKYTLTSLLRMNIKSSQKKEVKKLLVFFSDVTLVGMRDIDWDLSYNRNNQSYQLLIELCYLVVKNYLQTQSAGTVQVLDVTDEQRMSRLYEKFILEYYRKHYPHLSPNASQIKWQLNQGDDSLLPAMKSDIMLQSGNTIRIIDAKYYSHSTQYQFDKHSIHSGNLYQIFTYVKNKEYELRNVDHKPVSGLLLYAKTDEEIQPDEVYNMSGNTISVKTLDLNADFTEISASLNQIVEDF